MTLGLAVTCDKPGCAAVLVVNTQQWATIRQHAERQGWWIGDDHLIDDFCPAHARQVVGRER